MYTTQKAFINDVVPVFLGVTAIFKIHAGRGIQKRKPPAGTDGFRTKYSKEL